MATRLNPYLSFDGTARQAMEFYKDVFGGTLAVSTYGDVGQPDGPDAERIMHSMLETPTGFTLMASDVPPGMEHARGTNFAVSLSGDDDAELRGYWEKLSAGGSVSVPLEKQMWGDVFGMCTDRFGIPWMVDITGAQS
ncbi:VOC family protein [Streptomyces carpinensis]|uniref:VOC family protein n=1 Tax=Streptomyces carpinensis TaxID=66369 RepID=A0ABV1WE69_9ACTN|nr:VOC family protein [Streptomyces carpinensis]